MFIKLITIRSSYIILIMIHHTFLNGYQRTTFDYDFVFYDNIHYFLQEYEAWEKTYTSEMGVIK